jgi:hypothetical protein
VRYLTAQSKSVASLLSLPGLLLFPSLAAADNVNLSWDASTSQHIVGYNVYRGADTNGPYTKIGLCKLCANILLHESTGDGGKTVLYFFYVTKAVNASPLFPLRSLRSSGLTRPRNPASVPSLGFAPYAWSGITPPTLVSSSS